MNSASTAPTGDSRLVCHCRRVTYEEAKAALETGRARSLADLQRETTACTRCFGCRFELERMLQLHLGEAYTRTAFVTRTPEDDAKKRTAALPRRMYIPVLDGFRAYDVTTRVIMFNWPDGDDTEAGGRVDVRADLLALDGTRHAVREAALAPRSSVVLETTTFVDGALPGGVGVLKLVVDASELGSLRPYFHLISPGGITSTHEKAGPRSPASFGPRGAHWIFPIGFSPAREEAYFFLTNTQERPIEDGALVWKSEDGSSELSIPLPRLELDQSACVAVHDYAPEILEGTIAGSIRLEPAAHKVAGWMIRHDPVADLWRIQHL